MRIIIERPPMWEQINAAFHVEGRPVLFCWGDRIYNPNGVFIRPELLIHEGVHCDRQTGNAGIYDEGKIVAWWKRYIDDPEFRLAEEIPAHRAEYRHLLNLTNDRERRAHFLRHVASKLSAPLYGGIITQREALRRLTA